MGPFWGFVCRHLPQTSQNKILGNSICLNFCYNGNLFKLARLSSKNTLSFLDCQKKLEKAGTVDFKNTPGQGSGSVDPRFPAGLPFPVPEILEFVAFRDSGKTLFPAISWDFHGVLLENPRTDPGNSHSPLE